ncbi:MAG TPA: hypothetical protein DCS67_07935 [Clostridiales bacterium UBA8960]|jgi:hypothetical protein|nr:hypothetical protein [Clostridiales bacterium UBA8960]
MRAIAIASDLYDLINLEKRFEGRIHSIFSEVINVLSGSDELITIISEQKSLAPMCLQVNFSGCDTKKLVSDDKVIFTSSGIQIPRLRLKIAFDNMTVWQPDTETKGLVYSRALMNERVLSLRKSMLEGGAGAGLLPLISTMDHIYGVPESDAPIKLDSNNYCDFIEEVFIAIIDLIDRQNYDGVLPLLPRFIGFGPGLTPSTDDFLMGLVMTLYYFETITGDQSKLVEKFAKDLFTASVGRTTTVSEAMLKNASKGRVASTHRALIQSLFDREVQTIQNATNEVLKNGSTSGTDFLLGVYCAQMLLLRRNL